MWSKKNAVGKEEVAKLVDDIYRKMKDSGATDLASKARVVLGNNNNAKHKEEIEGTYQLEKVRCPCGSSLQADSSIQCEDTRCNVWQHIACVIIPEKPMEGILPEPPTKFYCELCRLGRADPFWVTVAHPLFPVKLIIANPPTDGTNPMLTVEKTFQLSRVDRVLLVKPEYDVQAWCMLLNDKVSFRMQWPQYAELQINGVHMRAINRPGSQLLGVNGRDDGPIITPCTRDGINKISLTGCDSRVFCFGVRIVKRRTVQQILNIIPKESDGERFEDALARVCRCVGGGAATENADSDSDLEVVTDNISVNLRCPMSGSRMKIAGRFKPCAHMGCFDLEVFVELNQRSRKWQCPICLKNYALENVIIDPYFTRITSKMLTCGEDVTDIEVKPDGSWRAKSKDDRKSLGDLGQWHLPDGTLFVPMEVESKPKPQSLKQVKQEGGSEGHTGLKLGMKKNKNGIWEVRKPENLHSHSFGSKLPENLIINGHKSISMSSSATGSGREADDISVNQNCGGNAIGQFDYSTPNDTEDLAVSAADAEVIVLSDSEDEAANLPSSGQIYENNYQNGERVLFCSIPLGNPDPHHEDPSLMAGGSSCLDDDFGVPFWSLPSGNHSGPNFQLFGSDVDPADALVGCSTSMAVDGYSLAAETSMLGSSHTQSMNADINDGLIDYINPLGFGNDDPSLQLFLPTRSPEATEHVELTSRPVISNGFCSDDWISLRLGDGGCGGNCEPDAADAPAANGFNSRHQPPSKDGALNSLADTGGASVKDAPFIQGVEDILICCFCKGPLHMGEVCPSFTEFSEAEERPANLSRMADLPQKASDPLPTAVGTSTADVGVPPLVTPPMTSSAPGSSAQVPAAPTTVGVTDPGVSEIIYVPRWSVSEKHTTQSGRVCRELLDQFRPPQEVSRWRDLADEALENRLNILLAQVAVAGTEVRTRWVEQSNDLSSLAEKYERKAKSVKKKKAECSKLSERLRTAEEEFSHFRTESDSRSSALALRITELEKINSELVASNLALKEKANIPNLPPGHVTVPQTELNTLQSSIRRLNADLDATRGLLSSKENVLYAERASNAAAIQSLNETNKSLSDQKNVAVEEKHWVLREGVKTFTSRLFDSHEFFEPLGKLCESARLAGFSEGVVSGHRAARLRMPITSVSQYDAAASGKKYDDALSVFSHVQFPYIHTIAAASSLPLEEIKGLMPEAPAED